MRDFIAPHNIGNAQFVNPSMMALSAMGEVSEYIQENVVYGINKLPGGEYVLSTIGSVVGPIVNTTHNILGGIGSLVLSDAQVEYLKQKYTELPHGMQVLGRDILDIATLSAAGKVVGSTLKVMATEQELVRNTKYINVTPDMLYKHPEPLKPHPKQPYVPPIVLTDVEYIDLTKPALTGPSSSMVTVPEIPALMLPPEFFAELPKTSIFTNPASLEILKPLHIKGPMYFDVGLSKIEKAMGNKTPFQNLHPTIQADFAPLVKTDNSGLITGVHHMQDHHILPKATPEFKEIFKRAEISIDDPINRILLPDAAGKTLYPTKKTMHSGRHTENSFRDNVEATIKLMKEEKLNDWNSLEYREGIIKIISEERLLLQQGQRKLNDAKTLLEKVQNGAK